MQKNNKKKIGQSLLELMFVLTFIMAVLLFFGKYIKRAIQGRWKNAGESFGHGMLYDRNNTLECGYNWEDGGFWYDMTCYREDCEHLCSLIGAYDNDPNEVPCIGHSEMVGLDSVGDEIWKWIDPIPCCRRCLRGCRTDDCNAADDLTVPE